MNNLTVFCDFDGTITRRDVGNRLFHHFSEGRSDEPVERWKRGEIDSRQCLLAEASLMRDISREELFGYLDTFDIDPGFDDITAWCRSNDVPLYILSDGLDLYIDHILKKHGYDGLKFYANHGRLVDCRIEIETPYYDHTCGNCANCKGYHIPRLRRKGNASIYIGDGKSDVCALDNADVVFARDYLAEYCRANDLPHIQFDNLHEVAAGLRKIGNGELANEIERSGS